MNCNTTHYRANSSSVPGDPTYGPGKRPPVARQSFTAAGVRLILASADYPMPMAYVDNVADAVWLALTSPASIGQAFTLVDENVRQAAYLAAYRTASGEHWRSVYLPVGLVAAAALALERGLRLARRRSPITYHQVRRATDRAWYDCSRANRVLGWQPAVSVPEGLRHAFAGGSDNGANGNAAGVRNATV